MKRSAFLLALLLLSSVAPATARPATARPATARPATARPATARPATAGARGATSHPVRFPADTAAHPVPVEWWYFVGHMADNAGHTYGFETTFFKFEGLQKYFPGSPYNTVYRTDVAISDEARGHFHSAIQYTPPTAGTTASTTALRLRAGTISLSTLGALSYGIHGATSDGRVDLTATAQRPPMLVNGGYTGWGSGYTYYYSLTHMQASGTLTIDGRRVPVRGVVWNDHQWGNMGGTSVHGWDWMALQLSDGADISLVVEHPNTFRDSRWAQTLLPDNAQHYVHDVTVTPLAHWRSPTTHILYPSAWRVRAPRLRLDVVVRPTIHDQEMVDRFGSIGVNSSYWEGSCTVTGTRAGHAVSGKAYTELTGYGAPSISSQ